MDQEPTSHSLRKKTEKINSTADQQNKTEVPAAATVAAKR
jgi:hypothetical protein